MVQKLLICAVVLLTAPHFLQCQTLVVQQNSQSHNVTFQVGELKFVLDYNHQCRISSLEVNGQQVLENSKGIYSEVSTAAKSFSTLHLLQSPQVSITKNMVTVSGIDYGEGRSEEHTSELQSLRH